jgi:hypothetical protein
MMRVARWAALVAVVFGFSACRTAVAPVKKDKPTPAYVGDQSCNVYDFPTASDVPDGSHNLGWVSVPIAESDEETFIKLRQKICEMGGDAFSQPAWVRESTDEQPSLKANAWSLP